MTTTLPPFCHGNCTSPTDSAFQHGTTDTGADLPGTSRRRSDRRTYERLSQRSRRPRPTPYRGTDHARHAPVPATRRQAVRDMALRRAGQQKGERMTRQDHPPPHRDRASHVVDPVAAPDASLDRPDAPTNNPSPSGQEVADCRKLSPPSKDTRQVAAPSWPRLTALSLVEVRDILRNLDERNTTRSHPK